MRVDGGLLFWDFMEMICVSGLESGKRKVYAYPRISVEPVFRATDTRSLHFTAALMAIIFALSPHYLQPPLPFVMQQPLQLRTAPAMSLRTGLSLRDSSSGA